MTLIHPTAIVAKGAELEEGAQVGPYSVIGPNVKVGAGTWVGSHVVIEGHTQIGRDCRIFQFASIGSAPQDLKYKGEPTLLVIGNANIIREYVTIQPGTVQGGGKTVVGNGNLFMACSHVGHDCILGNQNIFANNVGLSGHVEIHDRVVIGGMVGVHQFCRIGSNAMLSGGTMVGQDIPPYCNAQGDRAKLRGLNTVGMQRSGFSKEQVAEVRKAYRHVFLGTGSLSEKLETLPADLKILPHVTLMLDFIKASKRGICSPVKSSVDLE